MERDRINWAKGRGLSKKSYFPDRASKYGLWHIIDRHAAKFALGNWGWAEKPWRDIPGPIQSLSQLVLPGTEPATPNFTSRGNHQILSLKDPWQAVGLLLWLGARRHWCRHRKYYVCPAPLYQPPNYPPKLGCHTLALQGTLQPGLWLKLSSCPGNVLQFSYAHWSPATLILASTT